MKIKKTASAGTLESSDVQIIISNNDTGIEVDLKSQVKKQFGKQIEKVILNTLSDYEIEQAFVQVVDKGALDCVIKSRLMTAIHRSLGISNEELPWETKK